MKHLQFILALIILDSVWCYAGLFHEQIVVIDLGAHSNPIIPTKDNVKVLAFEPNLDIIKRITPQSYLHIIPSIVSNETSIKILNLYNDGLSSSVYIHSHDSFWNTDKERGDGRKILVPSISFTEVLLSISNSADIRFLKTDIQGQDFTTLTSAGLLIKRIPYIKTEVSIGNCATYIGATNDFCRNWLPYMTSIGYNLYGLEQSFYRQDFLSAQELCAFDLAHGSIETIPALCEGDAWWIDEQTNLPFPPVSQEMWPLR